MVTQHNKIKVALVGCGRVAQNHLDAIDRMSQHMLLVGLCDTHETNTAPLQTRYPQAKIFRDYPTMLATTEADLVVICTPSGLHPRQTILAAQAGKHVLTEKPMATSWQDGLDMVRACEEAGVQLFEVKQNRLNPTLVQLKQALEQGRFGRIYMVSTQVFWSRPQSYYNLAKWRGTWRLDGGAFMNQASHYIDLLQWLIGPVASVQSMTATLDRHIEAEDTGVINVRWRSGALGSVAVTMLTYPDNLEGSVTVLGECGTVRVGGMALNRIEQWDFAQPTAQDDTIDEASYEVNSVYGFGHPLYYQNVIDVLRGIDQPLTSGVDGLRSLELIVAAYRSARDGVTVHLPLAL